MDDPSHNDKQDSHKLAESRSKAAHAVYYCCDKGCGDGEA